MIQQKGTEWECSICGEMFGRVENAVFHDFQEHGEGELKKRILAEIPPKYDGGTVTNKAEIFAVRAILDEAIKDIWAHTSTSTKFVNLGDYVLVDESILKKWLGERQK